MEFPILCTYKMMYTCIEIIDVPMLFQTEFLYIEVSYSVLEHCDLGFVYMQGIVCPLWINL
jgi:hypothetical protein